MTNQALTHCPECHRDSPRPAQLLRHSPKCSRPALVAPEQTDRSVIDEINAEWRRS